MSVDLYRERRTAKPSACNLLAGVPERVTESARRENSTVRTDGQERARRKTASRLSPLFAPFHFARQVSHVTKRNGA